MAKLIIRNVAGEDREFPLADRDLRVGRGEQNDIVLPDPEKAVSRFHAELRYENGTHVLVDANSPNGIWVDGRRVPEVELRPGVEAVIGPYTLTVDNASPITETVAVSTPTVVSTATPVPPRDTDSPPAAVTRSRTQLPGQTQLPKPTPKHSSEPSNAIWIAALAVLLVITTVIVGMGLRRRAQRIADERRRAAEQQLVQNRTPPPPPPVSIEEQVRQHLEAAQRLFEGDQFDDANGELDRVNELDPSNADAAELRGKIQAKLTPASAPTSTPTGPKSGQGRGSGTAVTPASTPAGPALDPKAKALQDRYEQGKQALLTGDYQTAIRQLDAVVRDDPTYRDAAFLLEQARGKREETQAAAKKAEDAGDLVGALRLYLDAQRLGVVNQEDSNRVRGKMSSEGTDAFNEARKYYAYSQFEKALLLFQRAYQLLPDSDPNRKIAKDRMDAIAVRGRGLRTASPNDK